MVRGDIVGHVSRIHRVAEDWLCDRINADSKIQITFCSVAIMAQTISCSSVRMILLRHELFWFCLVQVSTTQFCCFPPLLMASVGDGTDVPITSLPATSSNFGSPNGSAPDLERTSIRRSTMEDKINKIYLPLPLLLQNVSRIENCVESLSQIVSVLTTKITSAEQIVGSLAVRVANLETGAASGSSAPDSARSWNVLGHGESSTATRSLGSHGPGSSDDNRTQDAGLILSQALMMNVHEVPYSCIFRVNKSTSECLFGSMSSAQRPTHLPSTSQQEFIAKHDP